MLQQTRSETVVPYYRRFLKRFPTVRALAGAPESTVLGAWSGLGYYTRARNLHRAARLVVERHAGRLPATVEGLRALPGIGRYTAGAIASIAFRVPAPVLDGNVKRVLARLFYVPGALRSPAAESALWGLADRVVPRRAPGDWNQALMELGASLCSPRAPQCPRCPVRTRCAAGVMGIADHVPGPPPRTPPLRVRRAAVLVEHEGRVLLQKRAQGRLLRGLWEFPNVEVRPGRASASVLRDELRRLGLDRPAGDRWFAVRHSIMNQRIATEVYRTRIEHRPAARRRGVRWFRPAELAELPLSAVGLRIRDRFG